MRSLRAFRPKGMLLAVSVLSCLFCLATARAEELSAQWKSEVFPLVEHHCYDCHGDGSHKGDLSLDDFGSIAEMQADRERWKRIRTHISQRLMPPSDEEQPTSEERKKILRWIDAAVFPVDPDNPDPGRVTLRRLNKIEYENTLNDLLGIKIKVQKLLPPDDSGYGFDNIGDVLTLSPAHLERLLRTARMALDKTTHPGPMPYPTQTILGNSLKGSGRSSGRGHYFTKNGESSGSVNFTKAGRYKLRIHAGGTMGAKQAPLMELYLNSKKLKSWEVTAPLDRPDFYEIEVNIEQAEKQELAVSFTNDFYDPDYPDPNARDRNLLVAGVQITGPLDGPRSNKPKSHRQIYGERGDFGSDEAWATDIFKRFAQRAFRRPLEPGEAERYLHFVRLAHKGNQSAEHGIRQGLEAMLISPSFLFREEPQPEPDNPKLIHPISEHVLASRLSYFLWSTMPDAALMQRADKGELRANLDSEIERMLASPRAKEFVSNFTGQWLQLRNLATSTPSNKAFPKFRYALSMAMLRETQMLFAHMIRQDAPLTDLLNSDYTFVNERLAKHYGIKGVSGDKFQKVSLKGTPRRGILGHGSFQVITSHPLRTSPVLRGKYVLENLLDIAPPPPPPNIPQLKPPTKKGSALSLRAQMEKHRDDPRCSSCHAMMDPIGFSLQNFDADGSWRKTENGKPIDVTGELDGGREFQGADELIALLTKDHQNDFLRSVSSKMLTYALGRGTDWYDKPAIDRIIKETENAGTGTRAMIKAVIRSVPFQYRRGDG